MRKNLDVVIAMDFNSLIIETDSWRIYSLVQSGKEDLATVGMIVNEMLKKIYLYRGICLCIVVVREIL